MARGPLAALFYLWDQLDVLLGFWLVFALFVPATPLQIAVSVLAVGVFREDPDASTLLQM